MIYSEQTMISFYQSLGKLFFSIAAADKKVRPKEIEVLKEEVKKNWLPLEDTKDIGNSDAAYQIEIVFDWLYENDASSKNCYQEFVSFKNAHHSLFTKPIIDMILKTSAGIGHAFNSHNKAELIRLAQLEMDLKH